MKRLWSILPALLLAHQASAQTPAPTNPVLVDGMPLASISDSTTQADPHNGLFAGDVPGDGVGTSARGPRGFSNFIGFFGNPEQNIDPRAISEIYPVFGSIWTKSAGLLPGSDAQVYGAGLTVALTDRFAAGLNQGGYADVHLSKRDFPRLAALDPTGRFANVEIGGDRSGWIDVGGFFQYTLIANEEAQSLLTGGLRWVAPCGSHDIFQGHGPAELAPYVTVGKGIGCWHALATAGYQFPAGPGNDTTELFYLNVHLDRQCFGWLYPLVEINWTQHVTSVGIEHPLIRGFFNQSSFEASGNIVVLTVGANAVLVRDKLEFGAAYSTPLATQRNFDFNGVLVKMVYRF
jgi:hypothetical protein